MFHVFWRSPLRDHLCPLMPILLGVAVVFAVTGVGWLSSGAGLPEPRRRASPSTWANNARFRAVGGFLAIQNGNPMGGTGKT